MVHLTCKMQMLQRFSDKRADAVLPVEAEQRVRSAAWRDRHNKGSSNT